MTPDYRETVEKLRQAKNYLPLAVCPDIDAGIALLTAQADELATLRAELALAREAEIDRRHERDGDD